MHLYVYECVWFKTVVTVKISQKNIKRSDCEKIGKQFALSNEIEGDRGRRL